DLIGHTQGTRHVLSQDLRDLLAGGAAHDLAGDVPEGIRVVADLRSRLPPELFFGDRRTHLVPVTEILTRRVQRDPRHTSRVVEHLPDGDGLLTVGAELGP